MTQRRIFITGVAGFLGSHLAEAFLNDGHHVAGNDNLIGGYLDNVPAGCDFHQVDCNDFAMMKDLLAGFDIVYHCAATAYEGLSVFSPHMVTQHIVTASTGTLSAALANRVKRFVMCSSMARYGENEIPFAEDMEPKPQDPYGIGKYASELMLRNLAEVHGMEWVVAVPHNIIGPRQKYDDPYRNVASIFINLMLQGRQPYIYGDGQQMRCFSFITDVINPLKKMAFDDAVVGEVINVGPDDEFITISELARVIAKLLDFPLEAKHTRERPQEVYLANCSADKARRLLGYEATVKLTDGLQRMIDYIRQRGTRHFTYHLDLEIVNDRTPDTWRKKLF
ncbi:MAG TPA: NAD-dependent epimerase/dehydratase family protein [Thermohalobaculum sp.]|nr:NAD-dependent epimerase/dehydratase family protein [Thermohalobaculum sp.]